MRLAVVGHGRMGRLVEAQARAAGHEVTAIVEAGDQLDRDALRGAEVAIEFTVPAAAPGNLVALAEAGVAVVSGTTGWYDHLPAVRAAVERHGTALLYAPNFSIGVQLFLRAAREVAKGLRDRAGFDAFIVEEHHAAKQDAPSGTALRLQEVLHAADPSRAWPVTSIRAGAIPGTHTLTVDAAAEQLVLRHEARTRDAFAAGALQAAAWLAGRRGVFTFEEMLFGREA